MNRPKLQPVQPEDLVVVAHSEPSILFAQLGASPEFNPIIEEVRKLLPELRLLGIRPLQSRWVSPYDEIIAEEKDLEWGSVFLNLRSNAYVNPDLYSKIFSEYSTIMRTAERLHEGFVSDGTGNRRQFRIKNYSDRHRLFLNLCAFWDQVIKTKKIKAIVFESLPHMFWNSILFAVGKARGIPCLYFHNVRPFVRCMYMHEDPMRMGSLDFGTRLRIAANDRYGLREFQDQRRSEMKIDISDVTTEENINSALNVIPDFRTRLFGVLSCPIASMHSLGKSATRRFQHRVYNNSRKRFQTSGPMPKNYLFLELQPENNATTHVKGFMYGDQREMIAHICDSLPSGFSLIVKENTRQIERKLIRRPHFWNDLSHIPHIYLSRDDIDVDKVLQNSKGIVELGYSSLALKAFKMGLPVVVLGLSHLQNLTGVIRVRPEDDLRAAILTAVGESDTQNNSNIPIRLENWIESTLMGTILGDLSWFPINSNNDQLALNDLNLNVAALIASWYEDLAGVKKS